MLGTVDWIIITVIGISFLLSIWRGFAREILSLATWALAMTLAVQGAPIAEDILLEMGLEQPTFRYAIAFVTIFFAIMAVGMIVNFIITKFIKFSGSGRINKLLGAVFGFARGLLIVVIAVHLGGPLVQEEVWWQDSQLVPRFEVLADELNAMIPDDIMRKFNFA